MVKEVIGHYRRKWENRTVEIQSWESHRISKWKDWEKKVRVSRQWWEKRQSWGLHSVPKGCSLPLSCCTVQQMLVFILPCSHREPGLWQPFQSYLGKQFYRMSLETISQTNPHCEDCSTQIFSLSLFSSSHHSFLYLPKEQFDISFHHVFIV